MRFVAVKSEDQQATLMAHKTRLNSSDVGRHSRSGDCRFNAERRR
jgi:hypothetical protein